MATIQRRKRFNQKKRLAAAGPWLQAYKGDKVALAYRNYFGVGWATAFQELEMLGIQFPADYKETILKDLTSLAETRKQKKAACTLRGWGPLLNLIAAVYTVVICVLFVLPPNELVLWSIISFGIILIIHWFGYAKKNFSGLKKSSEAELRRIEAELAAAAKSGDD